MTNAFIFQFTNFWNFGGFKIFFMFAYRTVLSELFSLLKYPTKCSWMCSAFYIDIHLHKVTNSVGTFFFFFAGWELNPGTCAYQASTLPLRHLTLPSVQLGIFSFFHVIIGDTLKQIFCYVKILYNSLISYNGFLNILHFLLTFVRHVPFSPPTTLHILDQTIFL